jgi:hypothetical protein
MSANETSKQVTTDQLNRIYAAIDHMINLEGQDATLVIEMSQAMLNDLITDGQLAEMFYYVKRYCDVIDTAEEAMQIADDI